MRVVVALGGNAILPRGVVMTIGNQRRTIAEACVPLASVAREHQLVVTHGNGPQVGLLALQAAAYGHGAEYPFDVLGAQTEGMLGYLIEQELGNRVGQGRAIATLVTRTVVDPDDPEFGSPTKFVGPTYSAHEADEVAGVSGWRFASDGDRLRRVVPSPRPIRVLEITPITLLLESRVIVICAGGGGVPTVHDGSRDTMSGVEAVVDKDAASAVLARDIGAEHLVIATDVDAVYDNWRRETRRPILRAHPSAIAPEDFPAGSMGPKVRAAVEFAGWTGGTAHIGRLADIDAMLRGDAGTTVSPRCVGIEFAPVSERPPTDLSA